MFVPLGGSRGSRLSVYVNLLSVMLISGLWHGAGLNFIAWGAWHGSLLVVHRLWTDWRPLREDRTPTFVGLAASWGVTFAAVTLGWALFAMDLPTALFYYRRLILG